MHCSLARLFALFLLGLALLPPAPLLAAQTGVWAEHRASPAPQTRAAPKRRQLQDSQWAFGQSSQRGDPLWRRGVSAHDLRNSAVAGMARRQNTVDTASGIASALEQTTPPGGANGIKGDVGMSVKKQASSWHEHPEEQKMRPDEAMSLDSRHVVRAYAGVVDDDLSISAGPELILKNGQNRYENLDTSRQPDSALGWGMQFRLDF